MYTDLDLNEAVEAGAITAQAAAAFRAFVATTRPVSGADEEQFRLLTGFNDIFVSIAAVLVLLGVGHVGATIAGASGGGLSVAATAWALTLYFTARRRMALPSIILLVGFLIGLGFAVVGVFVSPLAGHLYISTAFRALTSAGWPMLFAPIIVTFGAWLHWRRFKVPIAIACATASTVAGALVVIMVLIPPARPFVSLFTLVGGVAVFAYAMHWDLSDPARITRRADVAFWLHLLAAPLIVGPVFAGLKLIDGPVQSTAIMVEHGAVAIALYFVLIIIALVIDRRILLTSALIYVVFALDEIFRASGVLSSNLAVIGLAIGAGLLFLSALWTRARVTTLRALAKIHAPKTILNRLPPAL